MLRHRKRMPWAADPVGSTRVASFQWGPGVVPGIAVQIVPLGYLKTMLQRGPGVVAGIEVTLTCRLRERGVRPSPARSQASATG
jgi:hypothetical protein